MPLMIDGYNLLHHSGLLPKRLGPGGLERARLALLGRIAGLLTPEQAADTTIVFDAKDSPRDQERELRVHGIRVLYAVEHEEADELLEELIRRAPTPRKLLVVSSDLRVQRAAKRRKARWEASDTWLDSLRQRARTPEPAPPPEKPNGVTDDVDVDYWLRSFGFDPRDES
jgi:uncharacterized protein